MTLSVCVALISSTATVCVSLSCARSPHRPALSAIPSYGAEFDRDFLADTITHHKIAAEMFGTCLQKSSRAELTALCQDLGTVQQTQMRNMQAWLADWYGVQQNQQPRAAEHMSKEYRSFLEKARSGSGPEFEEAFLRGMRLHHRQGLVESKLCEQRASHAALKDFCDQLTLEQQKDMRRVGDFICRWYRDCLGKDEASVHQIPPRVLAVRLSMAAEPARAR